MVSRATRIVWLVGIFWRTCPCLARLPVYIENVDLRGSRFLNGDTNPTDGPCLTAMTLQSMAPSETSTVVPSMMVTSTFGPSSSPSSPSNIGDEGKIRLESSKQKSEKKKNAWQIVNRVAVLLVGVFLGCVTAAPNVMIGGSQTSRAKKAALFGMLATFFVYCWRGGWMCFD